ncbi:12618_t:CDS:2 [Ambispora gerdemannii]|uniref:12618_t:CDS:1 n=1 Tax=Ambispora gerdemannii TaxID=144530 RepID=A0A9N8VVW2_9GLOM|nr:12618_t:CDS:2 [Ambispora gerdemannii]
MKELVAVQPTFPQKRLRYVQYMFFNTRKLMNIPCIKVMQAIIIRKHEGASKLEAVIQSRLEASFNNIPLKICMIQAGSVIEKKMYVYDEISDIFIKEPKAEHFHITDLELSDKVFKILEREEVNGHDFLKITEKKLEKWDILVVLRLDFAKELKEKKLRSFSSYKTKKDLREVLAKHEAEKADIENMYIELLKQIREEYTRHIDELKKELESKKNRKCILIAQVSFMRGLELDAFFRHHRMALEVQGAQHRLHNTSWYKDVKKLEDIVDRDRKKRTLCQLNGIYLFEVWYDENPEITIPQKIYKFKECIDRKDFNLD